MADKTIYTVGGTVQAGGGVYIPRKADDDLLAHCRAGEFAFILSSRQVGKSSLMVRTARQLDSENIRSVIIDLSSIGVNISADEWYLGILDEIANTLKLQTDIFSWWSERAGLSPATRLTNFFRDVLLKEVSHPVVLFFDEIDSTLSIPFADDFFAAMRAIYNARSTVADFKRLSIVMIGVATPSDLIADDKRTPFNIGHRVDLTDFTPEEAQPLAGDLGAKTLGLIFSWTGGHPYLTQRLCAYLSRTSDVKSDLQEEDVANAARQLFEGEQGKQDNNLQFVRDMLTKRAPDIQRVLKIYKDIRSGKKVKDDERSIPKAHLKISGVVRRENGCLQPRNQIYERAFDLAWIKENTPPVTTRRLAIVSSLITIIALAFAGYFYYQQQNQTSEIQAGTYVDNFNTSNSQEVKITSLAGLFELGGEYAAQANDLFDALDQDQKLALFNLTTPANVGNELVIVVGGVYQNMENTPEGNALLKAMADILGQTGSADAIKLTLEINDWLGGREAGGNKDYSLAISLYTRAFEDSQDRKNENAAVLIDRAVTYTILEQYAEALADYDNAIKIDENKANEVKNAILENQLLSNYWRGNSTKYPNLSRSISIPTEIPTLAPPTLVPTPTLGIGSTMISEKDGATLVYVPAGEFAMGSDSGNADELPVHTVYLDAFWIDQTEVTNKQYAACVSDGGCQQPTAKSSSSMSSDAAHNYPSYYGNPEFDEFPAVYMSWRKAKVYCLWAGRQLPTEAQWEKAARGTDGRIYPWGNEAPNINLLNYNFNFGNTSKVGSYELGKSIYGAYDMAGNVREWVSSLNDPYPYNASDGREDMVSNTWDSRARRGGSWAEDDKVRSTDRDGDLPFYFRSQDGFRCALSVP